MKYYDIVTALEKSPGDKHGKALGSKIGDIPKEANQHNYGVIYDQLFNSQYLKKGGPLSILEIGIKCGHSIKVWEECTLFDRVVGVDHTKREDFDKIHNWKGYIFSDKVELIYDKDAYDENFVKSLQEQNYKFDIILDDGSHLFQDQIKFFNIYIDLLNIGGVIICEDISAGYMPQLIELSKQNKHFHIFDLRNNVNLGNNDIIAILRKEYD